MFLIITFASDEPILNLKFRILDRRARNRVRTVALCRLRILVQDLCRLLFSLIYLGLVSSAFGKLSFFLFLQLDLLQQKLGLALNFFFSVLFGQLGVFNRSWIQVEIRRLAQSDVRVDIVATFALRHGRYHVLQVLDLSKQVIDLTTSLDLTAD